ncbi:DUF6086 family protein [Nocardia sp. CA-290969]|uniref:DUF6086 family protein n=1 Tax=Nocardia sp. CA-290969 TaxID=3239986 RepID=UPI003D8BC54F
MSCIFEIGDQTVWSPALRVGNLYVRMAQSVAEVLGVPTGMSAMASDFWEIDIDVFEPFVHAMYGRYFSSSHEILKSLIGPILAPSIVMLKRGGRIISPKSLEERDFIARSHNLSMAQ